MDFVSHVLVGVLIGASASQISTFNNEGLLVLAVSTLSSIIPDSDTATKILGNRRYLKIHRHFTHQISLLPVLALVIPLIFFNYTRTHFYHYYILSFIAILSHLLLDVLNPYGTKAIPFYKRIKLNILSTVDPIFIFLLLINTYLLFKYNYFYLLSIIPFYILIRVATYFLIKRKLSKYKDLIKLHLISSYNPFRWQVIMEFSDHFQVAYYYHQLININIVDKAYVPKTYSSVITKTKEYKIFTDLASAYVPIVKIKEEYAQIKYIDLKYRKKDYYYFQLVYYFRNDELVTSFLGFIFTNEKIKKKIYQKINIKK